MVFVKLVVRVKLQPTAEQAAALQATLTTCKQAANHVPHLAHHTGIRRNRELRTLTYADIRTGWGLGAQAAQHVIKEVADASTAIQAKRRKNTPRPRTAGRPITFRPDAAQTYGDRMLSWQPHQRTVSLWTVAGRKKGLVLTRGKEQLQLLEQYRQGESDLLLRAGQWYLQATLDVPEAPQNPHPRGFIGVDLGIASIATTSAGRRYSGRRLNRTRANDRAPRTRLQAKGTRSAKRRAKRHAGKEARRARDINHKISRHIVAEAQRTDHGIAPEDLSGIRERVRLKKPQRVTMNSWAFGQLRKSW